ncbi:MAG TPA: SpoIID/LytB domain-containing protein [Clostridiaceae bacterium]|nr:SpoIID/LytB domain-containing protein [Clostridiaceae bacterium]
MKRVLRISVLAVAIVLIMVWNMAGGMLAEAATSLPEYVRIGLYFEDTNSNIKAVSSFNVSADKGLLLGIYIDNKFSPLIEEMSPNAVTVRKDGYFVKNNGGLSEYNPNSEKIPEGEKIGPYHIKIGETYPDYKSLVTQINAVKEKGIDAYPVYADSWQMWTGFYTDQDAATKYIENTIKGTLGDGSYTVVQPSASRITVLRSDNKVAFIFGSEKGLLHIKPREENNPYILRLDGVPYRGSLEVRRIAGSDMTVINVLTLQEYLYGVVPYEIEASSHIEALKAQAVAARTYTLNNLKKHGKHGFDLCPTTSCQVYRGYSGEAESTNRAVDETNGKVVMYEGKPAQVFYFSSSGGRTEDVKNVWGSDIPYLKSVEDKYESGKSRYYNWESVYTAQDLKHILIGMNNDVGDILSINITKLSDAGRVTELVIKGTKGECTFVREACRYKFNQLRSQWYRITTDADVTIALSGSQQTKTTLGNVKVMTSQGAKTLNLNQKQVTVKGSGGKTYTVPVVPTKYIFTGKGWGHAVGMSQEGAKGMALAGFKYDEILMHYFTGTKVEQL